MKLRNWKRIMIMAASLAVLSARGGQAGAAADGAPAAAEADYFWRLGVGTYGTPGPRADEDTLLTHARFDWQMIAFTFLEELPDRWHRRVPDHWADRDLVTGPGALPNSRVSRCGGLRHVSPPVVAMGRSFFSRKRSGAPRRVRTESDHDQSPPLGDNGA